MVVETKTCPQCGTEQRVVERYAFRGLDKLRSTLGCGHMVLREQQEGVR